MISELTRQKETEVVEETRSPLARDVRERQVDRKSSGQRGGAQQAGAGDDRS